VARRFVHFPLPQHRFARPAARAAECAALEGRFSEMHDVLMAKQDSFGLKSWTSYARDASVKDTIRFGKCVSQNEKVPRVEDGVALGTQLEISGTPTIVIDGWRFEAPPSDTLLRQTIEALLAGRKPPGVKARA
jgi:protein-disulfide isomerase